MGAKVRSTLDKAAHPTKCFMDYGTTCPSEGIACSMKDCYERGYTAGPFMEGGKTFITFKKARSKFE